MRKDRVKKAGERGNNIEKAIIALSPNNRLFEDELSSDFIKYKGFLKSAFNNRNVRNIAITGNHGVGKSSILRSYEAVDKKHGDGYLYISLMDFNNDRERNKTQSKQDTENKTEEKTKLQQDFERYLLCQILSRVDAQDLPHSTFRLIPSRGARKNVFIALLAAIVALCVFFIAFNPVLALPAQLIKTLYYICGVAGTMLVLTISLIISRNVTSAKLTATYKGMKLETENRQTSASYIDDHMFEIVYALETLAKRIGYTVVLEDMDRLGRSICVDIFSKLRRINYLVNDRNKLKGKYIRFIYAFDDSVFELTKNTKFFDYVMSVTPKLNYNTAGKYFKKLMQEALVKGNTGHEELAKIIDNYTDGFWNCVGMVVHDYRMINHIRNDFQLFVNVMLNREFKPDEKWLPFVIYKNVLPEDYCGAFESKGILETKKDERNKRIEVLCSEKGENYAQLVKMLFDCLVDELHLTGADFQRFTGLPQKMIDIRNEINEYSFIKEFLKQDVKPDHKLIGEYVEGKKMLVTGGGGAIGSELCRQLASYNIQSLIIVDISENNAYEIEQELRSKYSYLDIYVEIASICDKGRMDSVFKRYMPDVVFHAAAHKHIPFMEANPEAAINNNILGTYNIMACSEKSKVERFVLISTDKALYPTNIMGATKRICEMMLHLWDNSETVFCAVRFGNVLGANGSVIPLFKKQIDQGGPVTIAHPDIIRYFMTVPEACQLVLQATTIAHQNEILVLDMGTPVKIQSLAENLIRMSGLEPHKDIQIVYTGLRPGEKLYEERIMSEEPINETEIARVYTHTSHDAVNASAIEKMLEQMTTAVENHEARDKLISLIASIVPTYAK